MMKKHQAVLSLFVLLLYAGSAIAQQTDVRLDVESGAQDPRIAVPDIGGEVEIADEVDAFNTTLWNDLEAAARFEMVSKSFYPRTTPRRPEDLESSDKELPDDPGARACGSMDGLNRQSPRAT